MSTINFVEASWDSSLRSKWQVLRCIVGGKRDGSAVPFSSPLLHTKLSFRWRNDWGISSNTTLFYKDDESNAISLVTLCHQLIVPNKIGWSLGMTFFFVERAGHDPAYVPIKSGRSNQPSYQKIKRSSLLLMTNFCNTLVFIQIHLSRSCQP